MPTTATGLLAFGGLRSPVFPECGLSGGVVQVAMVAIFVLVG
jgi:hypothetical protein